MRTAGASHAERSAVWHAFSEGARRYDRLAAEDDWRACGAGKAADCIALSAAGPASGAGPAVQKKISGIFAAINALRPRGPERVPQRFDPPQSRGQGIGIKVDLVAALRLGLGGLALGGAAPGDSSAVIRRGLSKLFAHLVRSRLGVIADPDVEGVRIVSIDPRVQRDRDKPAPPCPRLRMPHQDTTHALATIGFVNNERLHDSFAWLFQRGSFKNVQEARNVPVHFCDGKIMICARADTIQAIRQLGELDLVTKLSQQDADRRKIRPTSMANKHVRAARPI